MKLELYKEIRSYIRQIIQKTKFENKTYCVGGCCRDEILGNEIKDIDLVIELENGGIEFANWLFEKHLTSGNVQIYPRFGTAMFRFKEYPDIEIEVVHTRCEKYLDGNSRNPETDYGSIKEDCYRRDLTINALYYNISKDEFLDVCGNSLNDIKNHIICTPYNPDITYIDDPLRILRCIRFATRYNWKIENQTYQSLKRNINRLYIISQERITDEFVKILNDDNYFYGLILLDDIGALDFILTPIKITNPNTTRPQFYEFNRFIMNSPTLNNFNTRLTALLFPYNQYTEDILRLRKFSIQQIKEILKLTELVKKYLKIFNKKINDKNIRMCQYECGNKETFKDFFNILTSFDPTLYKISHYIKDNNHFGYTLPVNGNDLMEHFNINRSEKIGEYIDILIKESFKNPKLTKEKCFKIIEKLL